MRRACYQFCRLPGISGRRGWAVCLYTLLFGAILLCALLFCAILSGGICQSGRGNGHTMGLLQEMLSKGL